VNLVCSFVKQKTLKEKTLCFSNANKSFCKQIVKPVLQFVVLFLNIIAGYVEKENGKTF